MRRDDEGVIRLFPICLKVLVPRTELLLHLLLSSTRGATAEAAAAVTGKRRVMMLLVVLPGVVLLPGVRHT